MTARPDGMEKDTVMPTIDRNDENATRWEPTQRIVCAANRDVDGTLYLGVRHCDRFMHDAKTDQRYCEQGFIDQFGEFLTRQEAWKVAVAANQIIRRVGGDEGRLYSENLY